MEIKERFLNYVSFDTQSVENSQTVPSTSKQLKLGKYLVEELQSLGIENAKIDEYGVVYGTIPSNNNHQGDVIGFIAHMDTSLMQVVKIFIHKLSKIIKDKNYFK